MLQTAQGGVLKLAIAVAQVISGVIPEDAESVCGEIIGECGIVQRDLPEPGGDDNDGTTGVGQLQVMVVHNGNGLTPRISAFSWDTDDRRRRRALACSLSAQVLSDHAIQLTLGVGDKRVNAESGPGGDIRSRYVQGG